ncbi:hypothetical protein [Algoriphagus sp.]|nr:hypothetical protein [Algoriphagus sp.]
MRRGHGVKVGCLITGDLMDEWTGRKKHGVKLAMQIQHTLVF